MADSFLSQDEVDALLEGVGGDVDDVPAEQEDSGVRPYNLATQERIVRGRMPTLDIIHESFARQFRIGLSNFLRRGVEISIGPSKVSKYSEFIRHLVVPSSLNMVQFKPLRGKALMIFSPDLVFLMVDNLFGGDGRFHTRGEGRDFTQTEQRIIQRVLNIVIEAYTKSWEPVYPIAFEYIRSEMNAQRVNIANPNEVVVSVTFSIELGQVSGDMHFCIPYSMIEPIKDLLSSSLQATDQDVDKHWLRLMRQQIQMADIEIVADLGTAEISLRDIVNMKVGDVIPLDIPKTVEAKVDGIPVMECAYGKFNGQYTLRVEKLLSSTSLESQKGDQNV